MNVSLSPDQDARLKALAQQRGADADAVLRDLLERALSYEEWFSGEVEKGIAQADRGELIDHEEVMRRLEERLAGR